MLHSKHGHDHKPFNSNVELCKSVRPVMMLRQLKMEQATFSQSTSITFVTYNHVLCAKV